MDSRSARLFCGNVQVISAIMATGAVAASVKCSIETLTYS